MYYNRLAALNKVSKWIVVGLLMDCYMVFKFGKRYYGEGLNAKYADRIGVHII